MQIAVNSVINWSFFYYICCFSIFQSNRFWKWREIRIELRIRSLDTWRHRVRDHSTRHRPLPTYWWRWSFGTKPVSPAVFKILASKSIGVKTLTFQGHVTSSVTWPFNSQGFTSYRHFIVTKSLSPAIFEIMGIKYIGVMNLTFQGHVTSSSHDHSIPRGLFPIGTPLSPSLYLKPFWRWWASNILRSWPWPFRVTWRHRSRGHSIPRCPFLIGTPLSPSRYLQPFPT